MKNLSKPFEEPDTPFGRLTRFTRTTTFRLTLVYATIFFISVGILFAAVFFLSTETLHQQARSAVELEARDLTDDYNVGGLSLLAYTISHRMGGGSEASLRYGLWDASGRTLAGNLPEGANKPGWNISDFPAQSGSARTNRRRLLVLGAPLPDRALLAIGFDERNITEAQTAIGRAFALAAVLTALLALLGGGILSVRFLRRVDEIGRTTRAIMAGDLSKRVATRGSGDELDRLASDLNSMLDRIEDLMEGLRQVSSDIAHDLRTPLTHLRQRLEAVQLNARSVNDYDGAIARALADTDAIIATFSALLRIAQIEAGSGTRSFARVDMSALCGSIAAAYAAVVEENGQTLHTDIEPGLTVMADKNLLTQMIVNLIENAIHHCQKESEIALRLSKSGDTVKVDVADTGPGIPPEERSKVLRRFYRLERSRSTPGSGLGLALVDAVCALHNGRLTLCDNNPGLCVSVSLSERPKSITEM